MGEKLDVTGSYFFNNSNTSNNQASNIQYINTDTANDFYDENQINTTKNFNHRVNLRFDYKIDDKNSLTFTPAISFQKNKSYSDLDGLRYVTLITPESKSTSTYRSNTSGYNSNNNLLLRHAFAKKGRTISLNLSAGFNHKDGYNYLNSVNEYYKTTTVSDTVNQYTDQVVNGYTYGANLSYTEPVGKKGQLQFSYSPAVTKNKSDQEVFQYDNSSGKYSMLDTSYSNKFDNTTSSHTVNASYRVGDRDNMFNVGISYKYTELDSKQIYPQVASVSKNFNNVLPNLMWRKKISAKSTINIMYRANTNTPSISQLQNVVNNSNSLLLTTGNPDLKQQVTNMLSARYSYTNTKKSTSFFCQPVFATGR